MGVQSKEKKEVNEADRTTWRRFRLAIPASDRHLDEHEPSFMTATLLSCVLTRAGETGNYDGKSQAPKNPRHNSQIIAESFDVGKRKNCCSVASSIREMI